MRGCASSSRACARVRAARRQLLRTVQATSGRAVADDDVAHRAMFRPVAPTIGDVTGYPQLLIRLSQNSSRLVKNFSAMRNRNSGARGVRTYVEHRKLARGATLCGASRTLLSKG